MFGGRISVTNVLVGVPCALVVLYLFFCAFAAVFSRFRHVDPPGPTMNHRYNPMVLALDAYRRDWGAYPDVSSFRSALDILCSRSGRKGPYLTLSRFSPEEYARDFWGTGMTLTLGADGSACEMRSAGPDRRFGTEDDCAIEWAPAKAEASGHVNEGMDGGKVRDREAERCPSAP
ncbi:MAG: hypothetical protein ACYTKD_32700 [Planctomycetota bacterium]|jgi:hypothetical protein